MPSLSSQIFYGSLPLILEGVTEEVTAKGQLDSVSFSVLASYPNWLASLQSIGIQRGFKISGYEAMWVDSLSLAEKCGDHVVVNVSCVGLIFPGEKRSRGIYTNSRVTSINIAKELTPYTYGAKYALVSNVKDYIPEDWFFVDYSGPNTSDNGWLGALPLTWDVHESTVSLRDTYIETSARPDTTIIGKSLTPPDAPEVPEELDQPLGQGVGAKGVSQNRWVLEGRRVEELFPPTSSESGGLWLVTDDYTYYPKFIASDNAEWVTPQNCVGPGYWLSH